jgi:septal ring factor EnvC (AmiA/AmiB activator)
MLAPVKRGITIITWLFVCLLSLNVAMAAVDDDNIDEQRAELQLLKEKINQLQKTLDTQKDKHSKLRKQLRYAEKAISGIVRQLDIINRKLRHQKKRVNNLQAERQSLWTELARQRRVLSGQLRAAHAIGRQEYMKMLLNEQNPAVLGRTLVYYDYLNRARTERIGDIRRNVEKLVQVEKDLKTSNSKLQATRKTQLAEKRKLEYSRKDRREVLNKLARQIKTKQQKLTQYQSDARQLESLLKGLREALADIPAEAGVRKPFKSQRGKLRLPVKGRIRAKYGSRRKEGKLRWQGVLIASKEGTPVKSVSHGRVAYADWLRGFGLMVIVDHGDGYMSLYGHNQSLFVETGDWIETGEVIGSAGRSGGQKRSGVYFEIRHNGKPNNPLKWCKRN